ncbi:hypothetical protein ABW20_dc0108779 [Dactylellina cionopaga]|nr:hypothetical protein ABW20_dc0108779 [Dactylellina cionopaga]
MIQIVVPGQAPREVNLPPPPPPPPAPAPEVLENVNGEALAAPLAEGNGAVGEGAVGEGAENNQANQTETEEEDTPMEPLNEEEEAEFWIIYSRNECFSEGYHMLEEPLSLREIAEFLSDWAVSINESRKNKMGLGAYWRRLLPWRRRIRDPRLEKKKIDIGEYKFTPEAMKAAIHPGDTQEEVQRRWWEIWNGGMSDIAANREWDEDEVRARHEAEMNEFLGQGGPSR